MGATIGTPNFSMIHTVTPWILTTGVVEKWRKRKCFIWSKFRNGQKTAFGFMLHELSCRDWGKLLNGCIILLVQAFILLFVNLQYEIYQKQWPKKEEKTEWISFAVLTIKKLYIFESFVVWLRSVSVWLCSSIHNIQKAIKENSLLR